MMEAEWCALLLHQISMLEAVLSDPAYQGLLIGSDGGGAVPEVRRWSVRDNLSDRRLLFWVARKQGVCP